MFHVSGMDVTKLDVDVALIPVGTFYTFGPEEALDFVKTFGSIKKIIPIHYEKTPDTLDKFIELAKNDFVVEKY
jgi:L-ascorbate metabolism protein UlaG (beta-lactamase superfamily)